MNEEKNRAIELESAWAVIDLPENVVNVELKADIYMDGEIKKVYRTLDMRELKEAFKRGESYFDADETYTITDKGLEYLENLKKAKEKQNEI